MTPDRMISGLLKITGGWDGAPTLRLQRLLGLSDRYAGFLVIIPHTKVKS